MRFRHATPDRRRLQIEIGSAVVGAALLASAGIAQQPLPASISGAAVRYEIPATVVAAALAAEGLAVSADRLRLPMPLNAATAAPALHIAGAELRHDGSLLLRVVCRNSADCMPFFAIVAMSDPAASIAALAGMHATSSVAAAASPHVSGIAVGAHVTLQLADQRMHIQLPAIAIDTGAPGAEVRVASLDRKHTYRGVVVDAGTVKGDLQ